MVPKLWVVYNKKDSIIHPRRARVLADDYYKSQTGRCYDEGFLTQLTHRRSYKVDIVNGVKAREEKVGGFWPDENDKAMQVVWLNSLTYASRPEEPVLLPSSVLRLDIIYCDPCFLATVKPARERASGMDVVRKTSD